MRAFLLIVLLACVAAFSPVKQSMRSNSLSMAAEGKSRSLPFLNKPKNLDGLIGSEDFDPIGFSNYFDVKFLREAELKNGRVAMLATVGWLVQQSGIHLPSPDGLYDVANPIDAFFHVGPSPILQIFAGIGALESINHNGKLSILNMFEGSTREPGTFTLPIYGASFLKGKTEAQIKLLKLQELKHARLAMFAIGGLVHHTIISGTETFGTFPLWAQ